MSIDMSIDMSWIVWTHLYRVICKIKKIQGGGKRQTNHLAQNVGSGIFNIGTVHERIAISRRNAVLTNTVFLRI